jgi:hypothetical protein
MVSVPVAAQEGEELIFANALDGSGLDYFGRHLITISRKDHSEAKNLARHGYFQNENLSFPRGALKFDLSFAQDRDAACGLAFPKQHPLLWEDAFASQSTESREASLLRRDRRTSAAIEARGGRAGFGG